MPPAGRASTSSRLPRSMASMQPARSRWAPRTAVPRRSTAAPAREQADVARLYMPISSDGDLVLGPMPQQRQRQADLVVLVGLAAQHVPALGQDLGDLLLGRCLGQRAGHADDERIEPVAPRGGRPVQAIPVSTTMTRHRIVRQLAGSRRSETTSAAAPASDRHRPGTGGHPSARRATRRTPFPARHGANRRRHREWACAPRARLRRRRRAPGTLHRKRRSRRRHGPDQPRPQS